jgi:curved DNA-binding protein CbpA
MMMEVGRSSHYEVLGVSPHATHEEIQRAFRRLARAHHPDANPDRSGSAEVRAAMVAINAAWAVLGDPVKRRAYDDAIGTTPRPRPRFTAGPAVDDDMDGEPEGAPRQRPSDLLVALPVLLFVVALGMFFFSAMSGSTALRTASLVLVPVDVAAFVAAPLFMMLRARSRDRSR